MDVDAARFKLRFAAGPVIDVVVDLMATVNRLDSDLAVERKLRLELDRTVQILKERLKFAGDRE